jgi:hypothetical protein
MQRSFDKNGLEDIVQDLGFLINVIIGNDVSDWSISFVASYLIAQSFCISIDQWFMKWSFLIGSFSSILIEKTDT